MPGEFGFDAEMNEVIEARLDVLNGTYPDWLMAKYHPREDFDPWLIPLPLVAQGISTSDPAGMADVVHMDTPIDMPLAVLRWLLDEGTQIKTSVTDHVDFLGAVPYVIENVADAVKRNLQRAFEAKYYFGRPRPEEVFEDEYAIAGFKLTAYPEGCPNHPAYPAGHGAAAAAVTVFEKMFRLSERQRRIVYDTAYHWAMYRTLAGVHYATDNMAGLLIGGLKEQ